MPCRLDSFLTALRKYDAVPVEPSPSAQSAGRLNVSGIDARRFPWIRPLSGDYAYNFQQVEGLYAGNPLDAAAWRDAVRRAQQHPRDRASVTRLLQRQQQERGAPPAARDAAAQLADPA